MKTIKAEKLSIESFLPFGFFHNLLEPGGEKFVLPNIEFYRDIMQQDLGRATQASYSACRIEKRDEIIDVTESHSSTGEGALPLDNDVLMHVGPASPKGAPLPLERFRVFWVPKGTFVIIRPGVWHHGVFTANERPANVLIVLPERTYANDCTVVELAEAERMKIEF